MFTYSMQTQINNNEKELWKRHFIVRNSIKKEKFQVERFARGLWNAKNKHQPPRWVTWESVIYMYESVTSDGSYCTLQKGIHN